MDDFTLNLFISQPAVAGGETNTSFSIEPTAVTGENAEAVLRHDHSMIKFRGGYCKGENFEYATAIVFDIDNNDVDDQADWTYPDDISRRLKKFGVRFLMVSSRNHLLPKDGTAPRPKFHVYLLLSAHLLDSDKFVAFCEWCIKTFSADSQVKSKAQKIFGFGNNPHKFIESWNDGCCIDEILTDDDLAPFLQSAKQGKTSTAQQPPVLRMSQLRSGLMPNCKNSFFTIDQIKVAAHGRELDILEHVAGIPADLLDGKHHPCPACGGTDRFRMIDAATGAVLCNQCCKENCGDFIAAVQHYRRVLLPEALKLIGEFLQLASVAVSPAATSPSVVTAAGTVPLYHWQSFPLETLDWGLGDFVKNVSESIGIDQAHAAVSALAVLSGLIGRTFELEIKPGYRELAMLWCMLIAKSAGGKSPALKYATRHLRKLQVEAQRAYRKEYAAYKASQKQSASAQPQSASPAQTVPTAPVRLRYVVSDATTEALIPLMADNPFGISLIRDELAGWLKGMDKYHSGGKGDLQIYIETHGGIPISVDRKTNERFLSADTPSLSIFGGVQTDVFRGIVRSDSELVTTGFLARFLMAFPPPEPIYWNLISVDPSVLSYYENLIDQIISYRNIVTPDNPGVVKLTPEAQKLIMDFQHQQADETLSTSNAYLINILDKAGMHCGRLALNLHVIENAARACVIPSYAHVSEGTMRKAITLTEWFLNESCRVYSMLNGSGMTEDKLSMKVKAFIKKRGGKAQYRDLRAGIADFHDMKEEDVKRRLQDMVDAGLLSIQEVMGKKYYAINTSTINIINNMSAPSRSVDDVDMLTVDKTVEEASPVDAQAIGEGVKAEHFVINPSTLNAIPSENDEL